MKRFIKLIVLLPVVTLHVLCAGCARPVAGPDAIEVRFYLNDGTDNLYMTITGSASDNIALLPGSVPERAGYSFTGWYLDPAGRQEYNANPSASMDVFAGWAAPATVTFLCENANIPPVLVNVGSLLPRLAQPQRDGYAFDGWFVDEARTIPWNFDTDTVSGDLTLYGGWSRAAYAVTFNLGYDGEVTTLMFDEALLDEPQPPIRDGYVFGGWYKDETLLYAWNFAMDEVHGDTELYARWIAAPIRPTPTPPAPPAPTPPPPPTPVPPTTLPAPVNTYTVTFDPNGGSTVAPYRNVPSGDTIEWPRDPYREGYTFVGWYRDRNLARAWNFPSDRVQGNITLYAKWAQAAHTVTFNSNGGSAVADYRNIRDNAIIERPADPYRFGYAFAGWYRDRNLTRAWNFRSDRVRESITLYAGWEPVAVNITVRFDPTGGNPQPLDITIASGGSITLPGAPARPGFAFRGWFTQSEGGTLAGNANATFTPQGSVTLFAQWDVVPDATLPLVPIPH